MKKEDEEKEIQSPKEMKITRAIDLINLVAEEPEPTYLWKGIPEKSIGLIAGVGKTGKTTFAENLAISIAVGRKEFFGEQLEGKPRKVLFINLEEGYKLRSRRNARQMQRLNLEEIELFQVNYLSTPPDFLQYLNTEQDWKALSNYVNQSGADVVFIDSLTHMCIGEIERSAVAQEFTKCLRKYLTVLDKTFVIIHHNTKGNEKPLEQDSIAGSRVILQEFEYGYGLANIPTAEGGNYSCMLFNKHIEKDDTTAFLYKVASDGWIERTGVENKFDLYKDRKTKVDWRRDSTNVEKIYSYIQNQTSPTSPNILTSVLKEEFVKTATMSKDTLYNSLNKLAKEGKIYREQKGEINVNFEKNGEGRFDIQS